MLRRFAAALALSTAALVVLAPSAWAHVDVDPAEAVAGATETLTFRVAYEGSPTTGVEVQLPEGQTTAS